MNPTEYETDYVYNPDHKLKFQYIGNEYIRSKNSVFGTIYVGENKCFNQSNFKCPFIKKESNGWGGVGWGKLTNKT